MSLAEYVIAQAQDTLVTEDGFVLILQDGSNLIFEVSPEGEITAQAGRWTFIPTQEH